MVWSEGNISLKNPVTPPGIDPGTDRLVAQRKIEFIGAVNILNYKSRYTSLAHFGEKFRKYNFIIF